MASSVYSGEKVYWKKRGFKKPGYSRITLSADMFTYNKAYSMCEERARDGYDFDALGMYMLPLPDFFKRERENHTFCSKHCTEVLQLAGLRSVVGMDSKTMTPSMLHRALQSNAVLRTDRLDLRIVKGC